MNNTIDISVIIPAFSAAGSSGGLVHALLSETTIRTGVIVVNDASNDVRGIFSAPSPRHQPYSQMLTAQQWIRRCFSQREWGLKTISVLPAILA
ncbi:hypothetical protein [Enterobacter sp.]|uniref:hypothetical protein n=1 Tax=Enterobacter sp. TaxID=42895 RepID=UPI003D0A1B76